LQYRYASWDEKENEEDAKNGWEVGKYWKRKVVDEYMPELSNDNPSVRKFLKANNML
jgi:hypothetical protein